MTIIGQSVARKDGHAKVTGRARFIEDYYFADMLYAYVVRSPLPHARIRSIQTDRARRNPGVFAVLTAADIPGSNIVPVVLRDLPLLAADVVRFAGEPIALVAATTREQAEDAGRKIAIDFEPLPAVLSIEESETPTSPRLYGTDNVFSHHSVVQGSIEQGFREAEFVLEETFRTGYQEHAYLERQGMIAIPEPNDSMTVMGSMQCPFYVHEGLAEILGVPYNRIRVVQTVTGGGFGGKEDVPSIVAGQAAVLAHHTKRPVKLIYEREEDMISMSKRHPSRTRIRLGLAKDGRLVAIDIDYALNAGAYATLSPVVLWRGTVHASGPYKCSNAAIHARAIATNLVPCGAFRGFGSPQAIFAMESMMDIAAAKLGMDPLTIRQKNILRQGDCTVTNHRLTTSVGLEETLETAARTTDWHNHPPRVAINRKRRGRGISCFHYGVGLGAGGRHMARAGADVNVFIDGSVNVAVGNTEMGQGAETVLSQIAAEALNSPYELVSVMPVDTTRVPDSGPTVASRTTVMSGNAVLEACRPLRLKIDQMAAQMLECDANQIIGQNGIFRKKSVKASSKSISYQDVVRACFHERINLSGKGWFVSPYTSWQAENGQGDAYMVYSYATIVADLEVDIDTGDVTVLHLTSVHDLGKAINPQQAEGQIEGGAVQGMSYALMENILMRDGIMLNPDFATYILPTTLDVPELKPVIVEAAFPEGPHGAKGLGEPPLMGIAPAIANAVFDAVGIRVTKLPILPEDIVAMLRRRTS